MDSTLTDRPPHRVSLEAKLALATAFLGLVTASIPIYRELSAGDGGHADGAASKAKTVVVADAKAPATRRGSDAGGSVARPFLPDWTSTFASDRASLGSLGRKPGEIGSTSLNELIRSSGRASAPSKIEVPTNLLSTARVAPTTAPAKVGLHERFADRAAGQAFSGFGPSPTPPWRPSILTSVEFKPLDEAK